MLLKDEELKKKLNFEWKNKTIKDLIKIQKSYFSDMQKLMKGMTKFDSETSIRKDMTPGFKYFEAFQKVKKQFDWLSEQIIIRIKNKQFEQVENVFNLKVIHMPLHKAFGRIDENKKPKLVEKIYEIDKGTEIDLGKFKITTQFIGYCDAGFNVINSKGICESGTSKELGDKLIISVNKKNAFYLNADDVNETWELTLENKNEIEN